MANTDVPKNWPDKLRAAARWFDLVDELIASIEVTETATGKSYPLTEKVTEGRGIQEDLEKLAHLMEGDDDSAFPAPFWKGQSKRNFDLLKRRWIQRRIVGILDRYEFGAWPAEEALAEIRKAVG